MSQQPSHPGARRPALIVYAVAAGLLAIGFGLRLPAEPARFMAAIVAVEAAALAIVVPFAATRSRPILYCGQAVLGVTGPVLLLSAVGCLAGAPGWLSWARVLWTQLFFGSWAALLGSIVVCMRSAGARRSAAQLAAMLIALAMIATPFYANWFVETAPTPAVRRLAVDAVLWANPWLITSGSILETDPIRTKNLYDFSTVHLYGFQYPFSAIASLSLRSLALTALYAAIAGALHALAFALGRGRQAHRRGRAS